MGQQWCAQMICPDEDFGGTGHGWASFVVTFGSSLLAVGRK